MAAAIGAQTARGALGQPDPLSFAAPREVALGHYTGAMVAGKFNGGPRADIADHRQITPAHASSTTVTIVRELNERFRLVRAITVPPFASDLATADLNGNGKLDLVVGTPASSFRKYPVMSVLLGIGNGTFGAPTAPFGRPGSPTSRCSSST